MIRIVVSCCSLALLQFMIEISAPFFSSRVQVWCVILHHHIIESWKGTKNNTTTLSISMVVGALMRDRQDQHDMKH